MIVAGVWCTKGSGFSLVGILSGDGLPAQLDNIMATTLTDSLLELVLGWENLFISLPLPLSLSLSCTLSPSLHPSLSDNCQQCSH